MFVLTTDFVWKNELNLCISGGASSVWYLANYLRTTLQFAVVVRRNLKLGISGARAPSGQGYIQLSHTLDERQSPAPWLGVATVCFHIIGYLETMHD